MLLNPVYVITAYMPSLLPLQAIAHLLLQLQQTEHLRVSRPGPDQQRELQALARLQRLQHPTFLQRYDQLFRWVSLWLLACGYALTNYQPHQVLAQVCALFVDPGQVRELIRCRHALKYGARAPSRAGESVLAELLAHFTTAAERHTITEPAIDVKLPQ